MLLPIRNLVGISPKYESDKIQTDSGITLYKHVSYTGRTVQGIVKYLSPDCKEGLQVGDYVFYTAYDGSLWSWKGETIILMPETQILCKVWNMPDTTIPGLYMREKLDVEKNKEEWKKLVRQWNDGNDEDISVSNYHGALHFIHWLCDKVAATPQFFPAPFEKAVELLAMGVQDEKWTNNIQVGERVNPLNPDLYPDEKMVCDDCGEKMKQLRERSTTFVFFKCPNCGARKDRKTINASVK